MNAPKPLEPILPADRDPRLCFIGTPDTGNPLYSVTREIAQMEEMPQLDGAWRFESFKQGGAGVALARDILVYRARCSGASKLILIDGDVRPPHHAWEQLLNSKERIVGALYPKKEMPLKWVGEFKENPAPREDGLWPMLSIGTGMIKIDMEVIDLLIERHPELGYDSDQEDQSTGLAQGQKMHALFTELVVAADWFGAGRVWPRRLTEDYNFSRLCREAGFDLWVDGGLACGHLGLVDYRKVDAFVFNQTRPLQAKIEQLSKLAVQLEEDLKTEREVGGVVD